MRRRRSVKARQEPAPPSSVHRVADRERSQWQTLRTQPCSSSQWPPLQSQSLLVWRSPMWRLSLSFKSRNKRPKSNCPASWPQPQRAPTAALSIRVRPMDSGARAASCVKKWGWVLASSNFQVVVCEAEEECRQLPERPRAAAKLRRGSDSVGGKQDFRT
nr:hypothetical protein Iba_chr04dCG0320 [Ipomoea batatas]